MLAVLHLPGPVCTALSIYTLLVFIRAILSFFPIARSGPGRVAMDALSAIIDPLTRPLDRAIPPVLIGRTAMALGTLILLIVLGVLTQALC